MADPSALSVATATAHAVEYVGLPEVQLNLAQAVIHMATAPKSNSATTAISAALTDVRAGKGGRVPQHLRDAHYQGARGLGHGKGYRYPHDDPRGVLTQQYPPDALVGVDYYEPGDHGDERAVGMRLPTIRRIVRGERGRRAAAAADRNGSAPEGTDGAESVATTEARFGATGVADERPMGDAVAAEGDARPAGGASNDDEGEVG